MKNLLFILAFVCVFKSCSEYQKALKSEDVAQKFKLGTELFDAGKYKKANRLFEQIIPQYRGKPQAEKLMYMHAMSFFKEEQYFLSGYRFESFASSYPNSEKAEEASFLSAKSYYEESPVFSKENEETIKAIEKLQIFINSYPDSQYLAEANTLIKELDYKLEKKAFEIAKQYNHISDYQASIKSFNNFLLDFPGSTLRKDALYYRFLAEYNLAIRSVEVKKKERIEKGLQYFNALKIAFPDTEYLKDAEEKKKELEALVDDASKIIAKS